MKTNFSMLFYVKKQKNYTSGDAPIYLRITVNGKRSEITTNRECNPEKWNCKSGRLIGTKEDIKSFNAFLDHVQSKVYDAHRYLSENEKLITAETLKDRLIGKAEKARMLIDTFRDHNSKMAALVDKDFAKGTFERYKTSLSHTKEFLNSRYDTSDIDIKKIDHSFITEYDFFLRNIHGCANNTAVKYMNNFGKIIRICLSNGWIAVDPFANYKGKIKTVDRVYLSKDEMQRWADKKFEIDRLGQVRDVFLFCCFTGLAYIDVKKLKTSQITKGLDGEQWIIICCWAEVVNIINNASENDNKTLYFTFKVWQSQLIITLLKTNY